MNSPIVFVLALACATLAAAQLVVPGGKQKINVNDEMLLAALTHAELSIQARLGSANCQRVGKILQAEATIVDGLLYDVTFQMDDCEGHLGVEECRAGILSVPWEHKTQLTSLQCGPVAVTAAPHLDGGLFPVDTEDEHMKAALLSAETVMSDRYDSPYISQVGKVLEAKAQVVAGLKYLITFKFGQTYRLKGQPHQDGRSEVVRHLVTCHVTLWMKPAAQVADVLDFTCDH